MNKINENECLNKANTFQNKLAMFGGKTKNNIDDKKKEDEHEIKQIKSNKNIFQNKNKLNNEDKKPKNDKIEEKPKETNNMLNFINELNKKEELNKRRDSNHLEKKDKKENKIEKLQMKNNNFQENRKVFEPSSKENKNIKEKNDIKDNKNTKEKKEQIDNTNKNIKENIADSSIDKKKAQKKEINNEVKKEENEKNERKNNINKISNPNNDFKNKINMFDKSSNNDTKNENDIQKEMNINMRNRSITVFETTNNKHKQEEPEIKSTNKIGEIIKNFNKKESNVKVNEKMPKLKNENTTDKEKKEEKEGKTQKVKSENIVKETTKEIKDEKGGNSLGMVKIKSENLAFTKKKEEKIETPRNEESKENSVMRKVTMFTKIQPNVIPRDKENGINKNKAKESQTKEKIEENNKDMSNSNIQKNTLIQQRILDMNKKPPDNDNKNKKQELQPQSKGRIDSSILERLKLFYNPQNKDKKSIQEPTLTSTNNNNVNSNNSNNNLGNNIINNAFTNKNSDNNKIKKEEVCISESNNNNNNINKNENKSINNNTKEKEVIQEQKNTNKMKEDYMTITNKAPKKLDISRFKIFTNMAEAASNVKANKREEIMNIAKQKKEEEKNQEVESDNENENEADNEEKEKEEEINEEEIIDNNNIIMPVDEEKVEPEVSLIEKYEHNNKENRNVDNNKNNKQNPINEENKRKSTVSQAKALLEKKISQRIGNNNNNIYPFGFPRPQNKNLETKKENIEINVINDKNNINNNNNSNNICISDNNLDLEQIDSNENINQEINEINNEDNYDINENINIENETKIRNSQSVNQILLKENYSPIILTKTIGFKQSNSKDINNININNEKAKDFRNTITFQNNHKNLSLDKPDNVDYNSKIFLDKTNISNKEQLKNDLFCECFFLTSFSKDNGKLLDNSEDFQAECNHDKCSKLPAMQPEIIYKYPKEDIKGLEINNLAASICYPTGIKLCYEDNEETIKTVKNYRSSFTNQVGERFFAVMYHLYLKMANSDFEVSYSVTPIKHQLKKYQDELYISFRDEKEDEEIMNQLNLYGEINYKEYVYVPFCLCLISRYPFIKQMEKCLESIMLSINKNEGEIDGLNQLITYIVKSIPAPPKQSVIFFPLPYHFELVEIRQPYFRDITQFGDNPFIILYYLSEKHVLSLFKLLIFEQKVLVVGKEYDTISEIILSFVSLLYPFEWIHTYIPIMSEKMIKFLQAFLPFFNGMNISLYKKAIPILAKAARGVFIFNIDEDKIEINSNLKKNSKYIKASTYIKKHFPSLPKNLETLILKELKAIKMNLQKGKDGYDKYNANLRIKNLFIYIFVELLQDYKNYSYIIDDYPVFNSYLMIKEKKSDKKFFKEFTGTQLFQMFIQNSLFTDKDNTYFEQCLSKYMEYKNKGIGMNYIYPKFYDDLKKEDTSFFTIKNNYVIIPYFLKELENNEEINKNKALKFKKISLYLKSQNKIEKDENINNHGVLRENKRIIKNPIELDNDHDPYNYDLFLLPGQDISKLIYNPKTEKQRGNSNSFRKMKSIKMGIISEESDDLENIIKITQLMPNKENDLSEDERDEIKDNIREIMTRIYRSDVSKLDEDKKTIMSCMEKQFGRDYFVSILNTGNANKRDIKIVIEESYDFFSYVIFNSLLNILNLEENHHNYLCAIKLLKACLCIKATKNKKEILLSDDLFYKLEDYNYFKKPVFWTIWVEDELTDADLEVFKKYYKYNEDNNSEYLYDNVESEEYNNYLKHSYSALHDLNSIMLKIKLKNNVIISLITDLIKKYIIKEKDFQQIMHEVLNELQLYKYCQNQNI